ncbi:hypothetical protein APUTEX25_001038, partial [Auxenochlorella protothecoides]
SASQVSIASKISGIAAGLGQDRLPLTAVCTNTCPKARDGVCQDGRQVLKASRQQPSPVLCDLGTDCEDCGPWITSASEEQLAWTPVADILDANMTITMRELALPRAFSFAVTDPRVDVDVSAQVMAYGYFEGHTFRIWHDIFMDCGTPGSHFIDVGGNFGYYSVMAAVYGCRVTSWEPVPTFSAYFKYNALLNDVAHRIELREAIVSDEDGKELTITIPNHGILGTAGVDVEGHEPEVFRGAKSLLLDGSIQNILYEYSPGIFERTFQWERAAAMPSTLLAMLNLGYTAVDVPSYARQGSRLTDPTAVFSVGAASLVHDLEDYARIGEGSLGGCPTAPELAAAGWTRCASMPEALHPQSYHSVITHNTNVWLARGRPPGWDPAGAASVIDPGADLAAAPYYAPHGVGQGGRVCNGTAPEAQVQSRCPCTAPEVTGDVLPLTSCTSASPPVLLQSCSLATPCAAAHWSYGPWSGCDAACGGGEASRNATCVDGPCTEPAALTTECNTGACTAHAWRTGDWQACSVTCGGGGSQSRTVPSSCTSGSVDAAGACCDSGVVSGTGACCPSGASLDASGACCGAGKALDACGVCGGNATAVDALGACCASGQLDAAGLCCASGALDACGVCDGLGTSCDLALSLRMGVNASLVSDGGVEQAPLQAYLDALGRAAGVDGLGQAEDLALSTGGSRRRRRALLQAGGQATVGQGGAQDVGLDQTAEAPSPALAAGSPSTAAGSPSTAAGSPVTAPTPSASGASTPPTVLATLTVPADSRTGNSPWTPGWFAATLVPGAVSDEAVQLLAPAVASSVAVCGNGVCELGEVGQAGSGVTGTCPADCPLATPAGCSGGCGAGTCQAAAGTCLCWQGYAGERCATCAAGYAVGAAGACSADVVALGLLRSQSQSSPGQVPHPAPAPAPAPGPAPGPGPGAVAWAPPPPPANGTVGDASVASGGPPLGAILGPVLVALAIAAAVSTLLCVRRRRRALSRAGSPFTPAPSSGGGPDLEKGGGGEPREVSLREKYGSPTGGRGGTDPGRIAAVHILCDSDDSPGGAATGGRYDAQASPLGPAGRKVALGGAALLARSAGLEPRGAREVGGVWRRVGSDPGVEGCAMSGTGLGQLCMGMHRHSPPLGPPRHRQGRAVKRVASAAGDPSLRRRATPLDPSFSTRKAPRFNAALYQCESSGGDVPGLSGGEGGSVAGRGAADAAPNPIEAGLAVRRARLAALHAHGAGAESVDEAA